MLMQESTKAIYDFHASFYDKTFGRLVRRRIARAISHLNIRPTDCVLDLGIGTGCSLYYYPARGHVIGIDLSGGMLRKAREKIVEQRLDHASLVQADAIQMNSAFSVLDG